MLCGKGHIHFHYIPTAAPYLDYTDGLRGLDYLLSGRGAAESGYEICL